MPDSVDNVMISLPAAALGELAENLKQSEFAARSAGKRLLRLSGNASFTAAETLRQSSKSIRIDWDNDPCAGM